jgi:hypothetical protein
MEVLGAGWVLVVNRLLLMVPLMGLAMVEDCHSVLKVGRPR